MGAFGIIGTKYKVYSIQLYHSSFMPNQSLFQLLQNRSICVFPHFNRKEF